MMRSRSRMWSRGFHDISDVSDHRAIRLHAAMHDILLNILLVSVQPRMPKSHA